MDDSSFLRLDPIEKLKLIEQDSINLNFTLTSLKTEIKIPTKSYVANSHENNRESRVLSTIFNDQENELINN